MNFTQLICDGLDCALDFGRLMGVGFGLPAAICRPSLNDGMQSILLKNTVRVGGSSSLAAASAAHSG